MRADTTIARVAAWTAAAVLLFPAVGCDTNDLKRRFVQAASKYVEVYNTCPDPGAAAGVTGATVLAASVATAPSLPAVAEAAAAPARDAAADAAAYLRGRKERIHPMAPVILAYVGRRFELPWAEQIAVDAVRSGRTAKTDAKFYLPLLERDAPTVTLAKQLRLDFVGLYCWEQAFPGTYGAWFEDADKESSLQDYANLVAAYRWAVEQGCIDESDPAWAGRRERFAARLAGLLDKRLAVDHAYVFAVDMLYYLGAGDRVKPDWIDDLRAAQRPEGAWAPGPDQPASDFTTALALWALYEASGSPRRDVSWSYPIERPVSKL